MAERVQALERGLAVIRTFGSDTPRQTLAEVARSSNLARATARRVLMTLESLGYVRFRDGIFELSPKILELGYSYLSSLRPAAIALPYLEALSERLEESCSVSVLDDTEIVYVARVPTRRIMTVSIGLGTRFPAYQTWDGSCWPRSTTTECATCSSAATAP